MSSVNSSKLTLVGLDFVKSTKRFMGFDRFVSCHKKHGQVY